MAVRSERTAILLLWRVIAHIMAGMRNTPVAEEQRHDHLHVTLHFVIPNVESDEVPVFTATTARHINGRLIATGPLFATAVLDLPIPTPGMDFPEYVYALLATMAALAECNALEVAIGTHGRKMKENIFPVPPPIAEPLW